jgi:integrase
VIITAYYQQRGDSYTLKVSVGYEKGKHKVVCKTWRPESGWSENKVKIELYKELDNFEKEVKSGRRFEAFTFREVAEEWFSDYADTRHRSTTIQSENSRKIRIYKEFGDKRLDSITPHQIQHFISSLAKPGANTITGGSLSYKTIKHHLGFLQGVFSYAVRMKYISENPCNGVSLGRKTEEEKQIPTKDEVNAMFIKMQGEPMKYQMFFKIIANTGLRRSEMLGLEWKDIDFETGMLYVRRTSNYSTERGTYTDNDMKTKTSRRSLKLSSRVLELLAEYRTEQEAEAQKLGELRVDTDRLFTTWNGEPMSGNTPYTWLKRFCERNNLKFYGIHAFRHFFASVQINGGTVDFQVSRALGHSQTSTTKNIYTHIIDDYQSKIAQVIEDSVEF